MKNVALAVLAVAMVLTSGCACMIGSTIKNDQRDAEIGRYQIAGDGQARYMKIDTKTGETWVYGTQYPTGNSWIKLQ